MFSTFAVQRLSVGSIYKLFFIGLVISLGIIGLVSGILALFGFDTVNWNGEPVHGVAGIIVGPLVGLFLALLFGTLLGSACVCGLWLYSKFRPLTLSGKSLAQAAIDTPGPVSPGKPL